VGVSAASAEPIAVAGPSLTVTSITAVPNGASVAFEARLSVGPTVAKVEEVAFAVRTVSHPVDASTLDPEHEGPIWWAAYSAPSLSASRAYPDGEYTVNVAYRVGSNWVHLNGTVPFTVGASISAPIPAAVAERKDELGVTNLVVTPTGSTVAFYAALAVGSQALSVDELAFAVRDAHYPVDSWDLDPTHVGEATLGAGSAPRFIGSRSYIPGDYTVNVAYRIGTRWTHLPRTVGFTIGGTSTGAVTTPPTAPSPSQPGVVTPTPSVPTAPTPPVPTTPVAPGQPTGSWLSGSSGEDVANGAQGNWRGAPIQIAGTWIIAEDLGGTIGAGREYGNWTGSVDLGLPLISGGQTYASCATGSCDAGWERQIQALKSAWTRIPRNGTLFVRLSWEMNGNWYAHKVTGSTAGAFAASWKRFDAIRDRVFPDMKLVFGTSSESSSDNNLDWRQAVPGYAEGASEVRKYVDVIATDFYNEWWSQTRSAVDWNKNLVSVDGNGAPRGLESYRRFALSVGLPFAISEWSNVASGTSFGGDQPAFVEGMYDFVKWNAGTGAGNVIYEIQFNVKMQAGGKFVMGPSTQLPISSEVYRRLF
jgi:hypothetical protein